MKTIAGNPYIKIFNSNLYLDEVNLTSILKSFKTPVMIFIEKRIRDNIDTFRRVINQFFENHEIYYSIKANFLPYICETISREGLGAEIISLPELEIAIRTGFPPEKIIIGGPYLTDDLIKLSIQQQINEIVIYFLEDIERVNEIAKKCDYVQDISIRINSSKYGSKLGVSFNEKNVTLLSNLLSNCKNVKLKTILSHYSTQMNNLKQFQTNLSKIIQALDTLNENGIQFQNINLGGGFPEATVMPEKQLTRIISYLKNQLTENNIKFKKIYFEPGRYFVGDAGVFITKIINFTDDRWIFLNIGNHICPKFARSPLRFYNISKIENSHKYKTSIAGIIPTDQDILAKNYFFTKNYNKGDYVLITNVGAYSLTFSNRFPYKLPNIYFVRKSKIFEIFNAKKDFDFSLN